MQAHLNSVTGVPVCHYSKLSWQPLNGEFNKSPPMPRTNRQLSVSEEIRLLSASSRFMMLYFTTYFQDCQEDFEIFFVFSHLRAKTQGRIAILAHKNGVGSLRVGLFPSKLLFIGVLGITPVATGYTSSDASRASFPSRGSLPKKPLSI